MSKDDISIEDDPEFTSPRESEKKLREKVKKAEAKAKEYLGGWQRAQADFANLRKRDEEAKVEFVKFANVSLVGELIPVLDSFNIALSDSSVDESVGAHFRPIYEQFLAVLKNAGVEEINPLGGKFDPQEHEALSTIDTEKKEEDDKVLEVLQRGYKLNDRVIRPAKVKVGNFISNN